MRGINREGIYKSDSAKQYFMGLVKQQQDNEMWQLAAWCVQYLETRADAKKSKDEWAIKIVESFCADKGIMVAK